MDRSGGKLRIGIFGCTGSIGRNALDIAARHSERIEVVALAAGTRVEELIELGREHDVDRLALGKEGLSDSIPSGKAAMREMASDESLDLVVNAVVGSAGLCVTLGALDAGTDIALANKESLVMAGDLVMARAADRQVEIRPIDSEHAALMNCLRGREPGDIRRVYLTASGGPFRGRTAASFDSITVEEALNHPTWSMGPKITIDSATLMNKGLEVIEAYYLFGLIPDKIDVVVHPQSIIHAMVEHNDGSVIAELAPPDMRIPIQRAMLGEGEFSSRLDLKALKDLTFEEVDHEAFPLLGLARRALEEGRGGSTVINAANEVAVGAFLKKEIGFRAIADIITETFEARAPVDLDDEDSIYALDSWGREKASELVPKYAL